MLVARNTEGSTKWMKCTHIVHFNDDGQEDCQYTNDLDYWKDFAVKWKEKFSITSIKDVLWSAEQELRLSQIQGYPDGWSDMYEEYVKDGAFRTDELPHTHPMRTLERKVVSMNQDESLLDMAIELEIMRMGVNS